MLKQVTVDIIVDDHEPEKCGEDCSYLDIVSHRNYFSNYCKLFSSVLCKVLRCKQCLEEAK